MLDCEAARGYQAGQGPVLLPHVASFGAKQEIHGSVLAELLKGTDGALRGRKCEVRIEGAHGLVHHAGLRSLDVTDVPDGDGQVTDGNDFEFGRRAEVGDE